MPPNKFEWDVSDVEWFDEDGNPITVENENKDKPDAPNAPDAKAPPVDGGA